MVSPQHDFCVTASQTPVSVALTKRPELLGGEAALTGMLRRSPPAAVVGVGLPDLLGVLLSPLLAAGDYFFAVELVVLALGSAYAIFVLCSPPLLVVGYLFFVFFVVFSARLNPSGRFALAFSYWAYCSERSRRFSRTRAQMHVLHLPWCPSDVRGCL